MAYILSDTGMTLFHNGSVHNFNASNTHYEAMLEALKTGDYDEVVRLGDLESTVRTYTDGSPLEVRDGYVYWNGAPLHGAILNRIFAMHAQGFDLSPMIAFLRNVDLNPSYRARKELYGFLENNQLPITTDGCFMAYKRVREDFKDVHSNTFDNSPGRVIRMDRSKVDDDPTQTCSAGLHVCSLGYLKSFGGDRLVAVKVNPKDVVAVPIDYDNSKMRVCEYTVVEELPIDLVGGVRDHWDSAVVDYDDEYEEENGDEYDPNYVD